jgi:DNA-directed RNA polymerase specialized sigma subunit
LKTASKGVENTFDKLKAIHAADPHFNRSKVAELLGVSRVQIQRLIKKIEG